MTRSRDQDILEHLPPEVYGEVYADRHHDWVYLAIYLEKYTVKYMHKGYIRTLIHHVSTV